MARLATTVCLLAALVALSPCAPSAADIICGTTPQQSTAAARNVPAAGRTVAIVKITRDQTNSPWLDSSEPMTLTANGTKTLK